MSTCRSAEDELKDANREFIERNYRSALELYNLSVELDENSSETFVRRSVCHQKLHRFDDMLSDANRAITLDPMNLKAYRLKAEASYLLADYQTAKEAYEKCQALDQNDSLLGALIDKCKELTGDAPVSNGPSSRPAAKTAANRGPKPQPPGKNKHQSPFSFSFPKASASSKPEKSESSSNASSSSNNNNNNNNNSSSSSSSASSASSSSSPSAPPPAPITKPSSAASSDSDDSDDDSTSSRPAPISERAPRAPQRPIEPPKPPAPKAPKAPRAPKYGSVPPPPKPPLPPEPEEPQVPRPPPHPHASRFTWVQTDNYVIVTVFIKAETKDVAVDFEESALSLNVKISADNQFVLDLELAGQIDPAGSKYEVLPTKVEVKMKKAQPVKWSTLERKDDVHPPARKKGKNWDRILAHEEDERDPSFNQTMRDMYDCASEEERRAMMKSFHESGGTVLSADWKDVGKGFVEAKPPPGVTKWEKPEKS